MPDMNEITPDATTPSKLTQPDQPDANGRDEPPKEQSIESANEPSSEHHNEQEGLTFWEVLSSTLAAALGVQSSKNRERDFSRGKPSQFIFMGIAFTAVFVFIIIGIVSLVLP